MGRETQAQKNERLAREALAATRPTHFAIPTELAERTVNFLLTCRAGDVIGLIDDFRQLKPVTVEEENESTT